MEPLREQLDKKKDELIEQLLDFIAFESDIATLTEAISKEKEPQTTNSGKTYHRVPFELSVETWDKLTPAERLKFKGLIFSKGKEKEEVESAEVIIKKHDKDRIGGLFHYDDVIKMMHEFRNQPK